VIVTFLILTLKKPDDHPHIPSIRESSGV